MDALGGIECLHGAIDTGYGTARFVRPARVVEIVAAMALIDERAFGETASAVGPLDGAGPDRYDEYVVPIYLELAASYRRAAAAHQAIIVTPM